MCGVKGNIRAERFILMRRRETFRLHGCEVFFFFKQKTAYEIGTGNWSSDVCSSDLVLQFERPVIILFNSLVYVWGILNIICLCEVLIHVAYN